MAKVFHVMCFKVSKHPKPYDDYCFFLSTEFMISVMHGIEYFKDGIYIFTGTDEVPCPVCGARLKVHGTCKRKLQTVNGEKRYRLRVMECTNEDCKKTHRELPAGIIPYKRMDAEKISKIAEIPANEHTRETDTSTWTSIRAWVVWFLEYTSNLLAELKTCYDSSGKNLSDQLISASGLSPTAKSGYSIV